MGNSEDFDVFKVDDFEGRYGQLLDYTGHPEWHAVYTIQLGELIECGAFSWDMPEVQWREAAFDQRQYERVCSYFIERFRYREISIIPLREWLLMLRRKMVFELMPKYNPLYERVGNGINPLSDGDEYYKNRTIGSAYPETLLSENSDYITDGKDEEFERIKEGKTADNIRNYADIYKGVDELLLDELECMFVCMYTTNVNGL